MNANKKNLVSKIDPHFTTTGIISITGRSKIFENFVVF